MLEAPFDGTRINYIQDSNGEILELDEVDIENNEIYGMEDPDEEDDMPELVFVDEKKELVYIRNLPSKLISRLTILLLLTVITFIWV